MHGIEVLEFVRSHKAYRRLPIIVLTTKSDEASRAQALAGGATLYLTKPFTPLQLTFQALELLNAVPECRAGMVNQSKPDAGK